MGKMPYTTNTRDRLIERLRRQSIAIQNGYRREDSLLTTGEVAMLFRVSHRAVRCWADAGKLPSVLGIDLGDQGYLVARVVKVETPALAGDELKQLQGLYANAWSAAEQHAFYNTLKDRLDVEITAPALPASAPAAGAQR